MKGLVGAKPTILFPSLLPGFPFNPSGQAVVHKAAQIMEPAQDLLQEAFVPEVAFENKAQISVGSNS